MTQRCSKEVMRLSERTQTNNNLESEAGSPDHRSAQHVHQVVKGSALMLSANYRWLMAAEGATYIAKAAKHVPACNLLNILLSSLLAISLGQDDRWIQG